MTDRARFGDLLRLAAERLDAADRDAVRGVTSGAEVQDTIRALLSLVTVMSRLIAVSDANAPDAVERRARQPGAWNRARAEASRALENAAGFLRPPAAAQPSPGTSASPPAVGQLSPGTSVGTPAVGWSSAGASVGTPAVGRPSAGAPESSVVANDDTAVGGAATPAEHSVAGRLAAATLTLQAARDLLQTHYGRRPDGTREYRSTWAAAISSDQVSIAMLTELARIAHRAAAQASGVALAPSRGGRLESRRDLNLACQWLWALVAAVRSAHRDEPVPAATRDLLRHIPVNLLPDRRVPVGGEPVVDLCDGAISTAERVRHLAWDFTRRAGWSPAMNITTLTRTAGAALVASHNCELLLDTLAGRPSADKLGLQFRDAVVAAGRAREAWLAAVHALADVTDTRGHQSPAAAEASDLALWTGRLAFAAPDWTPASGPRHPPRPSVNLVASPDDLPRVVAAVHYACETLTTLARTSRAQIQVAARASRILVPTSTLPESIDVLHAFAPAPGPRVDSMLAQYKDAATASRQATAAIGVVAEAIRAPSQVLTAARDAVRSAGQAPRRDPQTNTDRCASEQEYHLPGPLENVLHQLRITDRQLLEQATTLDRDGARLIIKAAERLDGARQRSALNAVSRSMNAAPITNHALASPEITRPGISIPSAPGREVQREAGL